MVLVYKNAVLQDNAHPGSLDFLNRDKHRAYFRIPVFKNVKLVLLYSYERLFGSSVKNQAEKCCL